ncbi:MAG: AAA family ATPase [Candidatus Brocadiales bacterium]|nr:AAA family ATPase [Candidatus Brocadiales bacterium]MBL7110151.1 AAA family ATPase [Candidatus Neomarinimicrobiota bacterium]
MASVWTLQKIDTETKDGDGEMTDYFPLYESQIKGIKGNGNQFTGLCPFHDDKNPSFSFNIESGLFSCFSCDAKGNAYKFAQKAGIDPTPYKNGVPQQTENTPNHVPKQNRNSGEGEIKDPFLSMNDRKRAKQYSDYLIENFDELTQGLNWNMESVTNTFTGYDPDKKRFTFLFRDINGKAFNLQHHHGKCIKGHPLGRLYPAHQLKEYKHHSSLIFTEGCKDVMTLISQGYYAVTSGAGANSIPKDLYNLKPFKKIIILMDNDKAGREGSLKLAKALKRQSQKSRITVASWGDDMPDKWDITNHFTQNKNRHDLLDDFDDILAGGKEFHLEIPKKIGAFTIMTGKEASKTTPPDSEWLIENILPKNFNSLLAGTTGSKKSLWAMEVGMFLANGEREFCGNKIIPETTNVLYVDNEVGKDETHRRYKKIRNQKNWTGDNNFNILTKSGTIEDVWDDIHEAYFYFKPELIIIDSLYNSTSVGDFSRADQIQKVINSLNQFKERYGVTVLAIHHFNKGGNELGLDIDRMTGAAQLKNWVEWCTIMVKTNVPNFNLWKVVKSRGFAHDESIIGLKWNDYKFKAIGVIDDFKPYLINDEKKKKWQGVLEDCPEDFNSEEWLNVFHTKQNLSERTGRQWLGECSRTPMLEKTGHNSYRKKLKLLNEYDNED